jgi:chromosome segregation ATPase
VNRLQQQIRGMTVEFDSKIAVLDEELHRMQAASASGVLAALRKEVEELQDNISEKTQIIENVRYQLEDAQADLTEQRAKCAKAEASLGRVERELAVFTSIETQKKEEEMRKKKIRDEVNEMKLKPRSFDNERKKSSVQNLKEKSATGSPLLARRRPPIELEPKNGSSWLRMFSVLMLFVAIAFFIFKKLLPRYLGLDTK